MDHRILNFAYDKSMNQKVLTVMKHVTIGLQLKIVINTFRFGHVSEMLAHSQC